MKIDKWVSGDVTYILVNFLVAVETSLFDYVEDVAGFTFSDHSL